jgi:uncharacterized RDD family membrane protein YckC
MQKSNRSSAPAAPVIAPEQLSQARPPGVIRRLLSGLYDLMLLAGVLVMASAVVTLPYQGLLGGDLTQGVARLLFQSYLGGVSVCYFLYFWSAGRQSLGMRAWRLTLVRDDGLPLGWREAARRLLLTLLCMIPAGLGLWWAWFDRDRLAWHDRLSHTRLVMLAKPKRQSRTQ